MRPECESKGHELALHSQAVCETTFHRGTNPGFDGDRRDLGMASDHGRQTPRFLELAAFFDQEFDDADAVGLFGPDRRYEGP